MMFKSTLQFCLSAVLLASLATAQKILLTNDDGWAVAQIRAQYDAFKAAGYDVVLSAPAENASGTGSISLPAIPLLIPCEYDSCPAFSPAYGFNASDPRMNYVNAFPADSARHGIQTLSSKFFDSAPDVVVSGPNVGGNTGIEVVGSGTVGAACEGSKQGIPSIAFSGCGSSSVSYTTLTSDPNSSSSIAAVNNAQISVNFLRALFESNSSPILPSGTILNVNFPFLGGEGCTSPSDVKWVLTRAFPVILPFSHPDVEVCGNNGKLPEEGDVIDGGGCRGSVSVIDAILKFDAGKSAQEAVLKSLSALDFVCFSG